MSGEGGYVFRKRKALKTSGSKRSKKTTKKVKNGILTEIIGELKNIREEMKEMKENQKENEKKFEEISREVKEIKENQEEFEEMKNRLSEILKELSSVHQTIFKSLPIEEAILGRWKMVQHYNFAGFRKKLKGSFGLFSQNVKFSMDGTTLSQIGGVYLQAIRKPKILYVKENHQIEEYENGIKIDRSIHGGKLIEFTQFDGDSWTRIYERVE